MTDNIHLSWYDEEHTIILADYAKKWTWEEFYQAVMEAYSMAKSVPGRADIIAISRAGIPIPNGSAFSHLGHIARTRPANIGLIVMVTQNTFIRTINEILFKINKQAGEIGALASTIEEAHELIKKHRTAKAVTQSKR